MKYDYKDGVQRKSWPTVVIIWSVAFLMGISAYCQVSQWKAERKLENTVFRVCEWTRMSNDSEVACGHAQDYAHMEYICEHDSKSPDNVCKVEKK